MDRNGALDDVDLRIIHAFRAEPRMTQRKLAQAVGVSEPTIYNRVRQLAKAGACEVRSQIDFAALGYHCIMFVDVWAEKERAEEIAAMIGEIDASMYIACFAEQPRILAVLVAPDHRSAVEQLERLKPLGEDVVVSVELSMQIHSYEWSFGKIEADRHDPLPIPPGCRLDEEDQRILETLRLHPRYSNRQIATKIGVSEATVRRRLAGLEETGAYVSTLVCDPRFLGLHSWREVRMMVPLNCLGDVARKLIALPQTLSVMQMTGKWNIRWFNLIRDNEQLEDVLRPIYPGFSMKDSVQTRAIAKVVKQNCDYVSILA